MANQEKRTYSKCRGYDRREVGKRIYEAWKASGLSQTKFIAGAGIDNDRFLRKVVCGEKGLSTYSAISLAYAHNLSLDYLYRGIGSLHYERALHHEVWSKATTGEEAKEMLPKQVKQINSIKDRICTIRLEAGLSCAALGDRIGYSRYTIRVAELPVEDPLKSQLNAGIYDSNLISKSLPTLDFLVLFANEFNISLDELLAV